MDGTISLRLPVEPELKDVEGLAQADVLGQLLRRDGRMRELGSENGDVKLDWVDGVEKALAHPRWLADAESEAADIARAGIRHVIWAGMGGSVQIVYALKRLGYFEASTISVHPLDSTDPAALNVLLDELYARSGISTLPELLARTMMIGVSMGMTSEEPITHLEWFAGLLEVNHVSDPGSHIQVMTLPGSYLDNFARARGSRMTPIQLDGANHTAGRMSAPATRVFLRPVALRLVGDALANDPDAKIDGRLLAAVLNRCQKLSELGHSLTDAQRAEMTERDPFVRLGVWLARHAAFGANKLVVRMADGWQGFAPWLEQLVEESLGKGGKGLLIFYDQAPGARFGDDVLFLDVVLGETQVSAEQDSSGRVATLTVPLAAGHPVGLGEVAALCLGFERTVAIFGYLHDIVFAGQPAVESYKKYARDLRESPNPVSFPRGGKQQVTSAGLTIDYGTVWRVQARSRAAIANAASDLLVPLDDPAGALASVLEAAREQGWLGYLDITFNGELGPDARAVLDRARQDLANGVLGIPGKLRTGPSDYHSTEQSETDGPGEIVSIRLVALEHESVRVGQYSDKFLLAQARGTWQAMEDAGRWVVMITFQRLDSATLGEIDQLFRQTANLLA